MIKVSNLVKAYGQQLIFDDIGFTLNPGERLGLVGRNGHGKTTLFRILLREEPPDSGVISIPKDYSIGHLSQQIRLASKTVLEEACLGLGATEDGRDETYRAETVLLGLGFLSDDFNRRPSEISGGYQVRLHLAKLLISMPNLLLLDEPTNYLDIVSIRWLIQFLRGWKDEMIIITHDRNFMDSVTTHTMAIHRSRLWKIEGPTGKLYGQIAQEEEVHEKTRVNDQKKRKDTEKFINRFRAQATKAKAVQSRVKALEKMENLNKLADLKSLDFSFRSAPFTGKRPIEAEDITFSFEPEQPPLIDGLSISVGKKDRIAVIGKNGKGKTTLLSLFSGELQQVKGAIKRHPNLMQAFFGQTNIERLNPEHTVEKEIMDSHPDRNRGAARKICGAMMFGGDNALKKVRVLSGGEKSRVLLGKMLVSPANLLLLDEPTNHLDMTSIESMVDALNEFKGAVIIVTHNEMILDAVATRLIVFDGGEVTVFEGTYREFLARVGWKDEVSEKTSGNGDTGRNNKINKKEMRRVRAGIIREKSMILGALQKSITGLEATIMNLEKEVERDTQALLIASTTGDGESIRRLSKAVHNANLKIETHFGELAKLSGEHDIESRRFKERLDNLSPGSNGD